MYVFPSAWTKASSLLSLKQGKIIRIFHSYRPIALTNYCCCKTLEHMVNYHLGVITVSLREMAYSEKILFFLEHSRQSNMPWVIHWRSLHKTWTSGLFIFFMTLRRLSFRSGNVAFSVIFTKVVCVWICQFSSRTFYIISSGPYWCYYILSTPHLQEEGIP